MTSAPATPSSPHLLVGVDFSGAAGTAWQRALSLGAALGVPVRAVHVHGPHDGPSWQDTPHAQAWLLEHEVPGALFAERRGTAWVELARAASEPGVQVMVIGSHGRSGYQPVRLGTTASRLAVASPVPVLIVRPERPAAPRSLQLAAAGAP